MIIDVSKWQGAINWAQFKEENDKKPVSEKITGVYVKATEGIGYIDPFFKADAAGANSVGLKVGFYHFASLNDPNNIVKDAVAEAEAFVAATKAFKHDLPFVLDIEANKLGVPPANVLAWIKMFFGQLEHLGVGDYALYSYAPFLDQNLPLNHDLGKIRLWLAAYVAGQPKLPRGWASYWMWQCSSKGVISGIHGNVDLNKSMP